MFTHRKDNESFNKTTKVLENICMFFAFVMPATTLPQIHMTYSLQDATGISLWMWVLYCLACVPLLLYGIMFKIKPIILLNVNWLIVQGIMIVGIVMYR